jgi:hypothetical protein
MAFKIHPHFPAGAGRIHGLEYGMPKALSVTGIGNRHKVQETFCTECTDANI